MPGHFLFADTEGLGVFLIFGLILCAFFNYGVFQKDMQGKVYWVGLIALHVQALFFVFQFEKVISLSKEVGPALGKQTDKKGEIVPFDKKDDKGPEKEWPPGQGIGLIIAVFPFVLPLVAAYVTGAIVENHLATVAAFTFWSLVQTLIMGKISGEDEKISWLGPLIRSTVPVISILISLARAYSS